MTIPARHTFTARLERAGTLYVIAIPAAVSRAIGKRGNVPVIAWVNDVAEVRASLVPAGGGRHRLRLNAATRKLAGVAVGDRLSVALAVDEAPVAEPMPPDLARALADAHALETFERFPVGKQSHIIQWIEKAAREETRDKRIALTVEIALRGVERALDRQAATGRARRRSP